MMACYNKMLEVFNENNLSNHTGGLQYELTSGGKGFRIWIEDWVVFFNEYGTGVYTQSPLGNMSGKNYWVYFKDGRFFGTNGQRPKFMFNDVEKKLKIAVGEVYSSMISNTISQKSYEIFKSTADGSKALE